MCTGGRDDIRPPAGLLHPEATKEERADGRGKARARFLWFLQSVGRSGHSASVVGVGRLLGFSADWWARCFTSEATVFSRRCPVLVLPSILSVDRCSLVRNQQRCMKVCAFRSADC